MTGFLRDLDSVRLRDCRDGLFLFPRADRYVGRSLDLYGEYSPAERDLLVGLVPRGGVVLDVGANLGALSIPLARAAGPEGAVVALEPQRLLHQILCANVALNGLVNVHPRPVAAGRRAGTVLVPRLDLAAEQNLGGLSLEDSAAGEPVAVLGLDAFDLPRLDLLKVDVEGMEEDVLVGAAETIGEHRPVLYVENDRTEKSESLLRHLISLGYRLYWHLPPLFCPGNYRGEEKNAFPGIVSVNVLGIPEESPRRFEGLRPVSSPSDRFDDPAGRASGA